MNAEQEVCTNSAPPCLRTQVSSLAIGPYHQVVESNQYLGNSLWCLWGREILGTFLANKSTRCNPSPTLGGLRCLIGALPLLLYSDSTQTPFTNVYILGNVYRGSFPKRPLVSVVPSFLYPALPFPSPFGSPGLVPCIFPYRYTLFPFLGIFLSSWLLTRFLISMVI